jgi:hypothetical protein
LETDWLEYQEKEANNVSSEIEIKLGAIRYQIVPPLRGSKGLIALVFYKRKQG